MTSQKLLRLITAALAILVVAAPVAAAAKKNSIKVSRGATTLALGSDAATALESLGIAVAPLKPAKAGDAGIAFPVSNGKLNAKTYAGAVKHTGGLRFSRDDTVVDLRNFTIRIDDAPDLTARVGDMRASIADLDLSEADITATKKRLTVAGVLVTLSQDGADALNGAFATTAFTKGLELGEATLATRIVGTKKK
jgi:hypothetical protein